MSTLTVRGDFTIYGNGGSFVYNGTSSTDAATLTIGGSFSLGANSFIYEYSTKAFSVTNHFTLGANSYFDDYGTMSVGGNFDPGTGSPYTVDGMYGTFDAGSGSTVTTNTSTWEVFAGGQLDVAAGGSLTVEGQLIDNGTIDPPSGGAITVSGNGVLTLDAGAALVVARSLVVEDSGQVDVYGTLIALSPSALDVKDSGQIITETGGQVDVLSLNPVNIFYGAALDNTQLNGMFTYNGQAVAGTFTYTSAAGTVIGTGNGQSESVTFRPGDTADYPTFSTMVTVNVARATPTVSVNAVNLTYGAGLANSQLGGTATWIVGGNTVTVAGTFTFTNPAGTLLGAGNGQSEAVTFTPSDTTDYTTASPTVTVNVAQATPTVSVNPVVNLTYGTALANSQLSGTATWVVGGNTVTVAGTLTYTSAAGTVLKAGTGQSEAVTFTPSDTTYYSTASQTLVVNVARATPTVSLNTVNLTYGTALANGQLGGTATWIVGGNTVSVAGTFNFTNAAGTLLHAGNGQSEAVTFTPSDTTDYTTAPPTVVVNVAQATPTVSVNAANLTYGTPLANSQLGAPPGSSAAIPSPSRALFAHQPAGTLLGGTVLSAQQRPERGVHLHAQRHHRLHHRVSHGDRLSMLPGPLLPTVSTSVKCTYSSSPQGYPTGAVNVMGANKLTNTGGTLSFSYNGSNNVPTHAGTYSVVVTFTPNDTIDYTNASTTTTWTIKRATPGITWNNPSAIASFMPLGSSQLNAVATAPGTFAYTPPAGTHLSAGTQTLSTQFTPSDSTDYTNATATVSLVVLGPGVTVIGTTLYFVGGNACTNQIQINPAGTSNTGSTGVKVNASLNGVNTQTTFSQSFTTISRFLQDGNSNIQLASSLTIDAVVTAGNGNDNVQLGNGNNIVTLGNGNDTIQAGSGSSTVMAGNGNDNVQLGGGSGDNVTLGNGNDNVQIGNGSYEVVVLGNGNDNVQLGNGSGDTVTLGTGNDNVQIGNGSCNSVKLPGNGNGHDHIKFGNGSNNIS